MAEVSLVELIVAQGFAPSVTVVAVGFGVPAFLFRRLRRSW